MLSDVILINNNLGIISREKLEMSVGLLVAFRQFTADPNPRRHGSDSNRLAKLNTNSLTRK